MKLSEKTLLVLKNFQKINKGLVLVKGNLLMTKSDDNVLYAEATIDETISEDFAIYDLGEFINYLSLIGIDSKLEPNMVDLKLRIKGESGKKGVMNLADPSVVVHPKKRITTPVADVLFELKSEQFDDILNGASISGHKTLRFSVGDHQGTPHIFADVMDPKDSSANIVSFPIQVYDGKDEFNFYVNIDNLKMLKSDYKVEVSQKGAITFVNDSVKYVVALEATSSFIAG